MGWKIFNSWKDTVIESCFDTISGLNHQLEEASKYQFRLMDIIQERTKEITVLQKENNELRKQLEKLQEV